jgi:hypothetical protein
MISLPGLDPCVGIFPVRRLQGWVVVGYTWWNICYLSFSFFFFVVFMAFSEGSAFILAIKTGVGH